jgi:hypothetical protein
VKLTLFDENGTIANSSPGASDGSLVMTIKPNYHIARYLNQLFPNTKLTGRARLDLQSDLPILGTALTDKNGQFSSLPFLPGVKAYTWAATLGTMSATGDMSLRVDGFFVTGYFYLQTMNGVNMKRSSPKFNAMSGELVEGVLELQFTGGRGKSPAGDFMGGDFVADLVFSPFSLSAATVTGSFTQFMHDLTVQGPYQFIFTAIN